MKISFIVHPNCCVSGAGNGVLKQASVWAKGLRELGARVDIIGPENFIVSGSIKEYEIVHFFSHGYWLKDFLGNLPRGPKYFFSPILDSTKSPKFYGILAKLPLNSYITVFGPRLLREFSEKTIVSARSSHEEKLMSYISPNARIRKHQISMSIQDGPIKTPNISIPPNYVLFVGNLNGDRKNAKKLIKACDALSLPLVLAGNLTCDTSRKEIESMIAECETSIILTGFVDTSELRWLYTNCALFCLPSRIEGVGQVALEALYYGSRLAVTNVGGAPDYLKEWAEYLDPSSTESIKCAISRALKRPKPSILNARNYLVNFDRKNTATRLMQSYIEASKLAIS